LLLLQLLLLLLLLLLLFKRRGREAAGRTAVFWKKKGSVIFWNVFHIHFKFIYFFFASASIIQQILIVAHSSLFLGASSFQQRQFRSSGISRTFINAPTFSDCHHSFAHIKDADAGYEAPKQPIGALPLDNIYIMDTNLVIGYIQAYKMILLVGKLGRITTYHLVAEIFCCFLKPSRKLALNVRIFAKG